MIQIWAYRERIDWGSSLTLVSGFIKVSRYPKVCREILIMANQCYQVMNQKYYSHVMHIYKPSRMKYHGLSLKKILKYKYITYEYKKNWSAQSKPSNSVFYVVLIHTTSRSANDATHLSKIKCKLRNVNNALIYTPIHFSYKKQLLRFWYHLELINYFFCPKNKTS